MKKQKITVVLSRTQYDPMTAWQDIKFVDIEVDDDGKGEWHVTGGNTVITESQKSITDKCIEEIGCAMCHYGDLPYCEPERARNRVPGKYIMPDSTTGQIDKL